MTKGFVSEFETPNASPGFLLWQVTNAWQRHLRTALDELDLTHVQFVLLASLAFHTQANTTQSVSQVQLAQHAKTDVMMTSQVVRTLEEKGLLKRTPSLSDSRVKSLTITDKGLERAKIAIQLVEQADAEFFATLDQPYLAIFVQALQKLM